jgi:hypothetical protein
MTRLTQTLKDDSKTIAALSALAAAEEAGAPASDEAGAEAGPAPAPEQAPEPQPKMVPLAALQEERAGRRALRERMAAMDARFRQFIAARAAQAAQIHAQAQAPAAPAAPPPPSFDANPTAHLKAESEATKQTVEQIRTALAQRQLAELRAAAQAQFLDRYHSSARDFAERVPDFGQAYAHACADRDAELAELGYADPALRRQIVQAEETPRASTRPSASTSSRAAGDIAAPARSMRARSSNRSRVARRRRARCQAWAGRRRCRRGSKTSPTCPTRNSPRRPRVSTGAGCCGARTRAQWASCWGGPSPCAAPATRGRR